MMSAVFACCFPVRLLRARRLHWLAAILGAATALCHASATPAIFSWGNGVWGTLGNNDVNDSPVAVPVVMTGALAGKTVVAVAHGQNHALALTSDGKVYSWGVNDNGQLGNTTVARYSAVPVAVDMTGVLAGKTVTKIAAAEFFSLVLTSDGKLYTWGYNGYGSLGNNSGIYTQSGVPVAVDMTGVLAGKTPTDISAGGSSGSGFCLVLTADHKLYSWGGGGYGQLGNGSSSTAYVPVAVDMTGVLAGKTITAISAGDMHAMVLASDGTVYTWGFNNLSQLGIGTSGGYSASPVAVDTSGVLAGKTITSIAAGGYFSMALSSTGQVYSWGANDQGQLGNNSQTDSAVPVAVNTAGVLSGVTLTQLAGGYNFALGLSSTGDVYSWGGNNNGTLGGSSAPYSYSKVPIAVDTSGVLNGLTITAISQGESAMRAFVLGNVTTPVINTQPAAVSVNAGASASFSVSASGGALSYQWYKGGSAITGATNSTYSIASTVTGDAGSYSVTVSNAAGSTPSNSATLTVNVVLLPQTITFTPIPNHVFGDNPFNVSATSDASLSVTYSIVSGPATITGQSITITGTGTVTVQASQAGNSTYASATATTSFTVSAATAVVSLSNLSAVFDGSPKPVTVSTVPVGLSTSVTYNGSATVPSAVGSYAVAATVTSANYTGTASGTLTISPAVTSQTINFAAIADYTYGEGPAPLSATASSGLPVTFKIVSGPGMIMGPRVYFMGPGVVRVEADQAGNGTYPPASVTQSFTIYPAHATITLGNLKQNYDGVAKPVSVTTNPAGLSVDLKYDGADAVPTTVGQHTVMATISDWRYIGSTSAVLTIQYPPAITVQPASQSLPFHGAANLSVTAVGDTPLTYQWFRDGTSIAGANSSTYAASVSGTYTVTVANTTGTVTSSPATVSIASRLLNISARARVGTGANVLIPGFAVTAPTGLKKRLLIRAIGPGLASFGVTGTLAKPQLTLMASNTALAKNVGWDTGADASAIAAAAAKVGAFPLATGSGDSALLFDAPAGSYSVVIEGVGNTTGVALAEVYELDADDGLLVNLGARMMAGSGDNVAIGGLVVGGTSPVHVLVRAVGPTLSTYGVTGVLAQPQLTITKGNTTVATNAGWSTSADASAIAAAAAANGAFALPSGSSDAAVLLTLQPGAYTAQITGTGGTSGVALLEVYEIP